MTNCLLSQSTSQSISQSISRSLRRTVLSSRTLLSPSRTFSSSVSRHPSAIIQSSIISSSHYVNLAHSFQSRHPSSIHETNATTHHLLSPSSTTYSTCYTNFKWTLPQLFNIGVDCSDKHVLAGRGDHPAVIVQSINGNSETYTFSNLSILSNQFSNCLKYLYNIKQLNTVTILLPQGIETVISHLGIYKAGAIAVPLFILFEEDALIYRLNNSQASVVVTNEIGKQKLLPLLSQLPYLKHIIDTTKPSSSIIRHPSFSTHHASCTAHSSITQTNFWDTISTAASICLPCHSSIDDPALIIYTSGTTGPPKGALHAHRVLLGHLPGIEFPHEFYPHYQRNVLESAGVFWTPADWAWIGGLLDALLPSLHYGQPILALRQDKFNADECLYYIGKHGVQHAFIPPTALKLMKQSITSTNIKKHNVKLRSIFSGGESLGESLIDWGRETLDVTINEAYGQTECNLVVGNCNHIMPPKPGSMGRAIPGHIVAILNDNGEEVPHGEIGHIAVLAGDPVQFIGYYNNPTATLKKYITNKNGHSWLLTGDQGRMDSDEYIWYIGRDDDVITSAGYRIGPSEIEDTLSKHPAVALSAVVGKPDPIRTEIVKAFIVLSPHGVSQIQKHNGNDKDLKTDIQNFIKTKLAKHEYPREIEFIDALPMTTTGKIMRRLLRNR